MRLALVCALLFAVTPARAAGPSDKAARFDAAKAVYAKRAKLRNHQLAFHMLAELAKGHPLDRELQLWCTRTAYYCGHRIEDANKRAKITFAGFTCAKRMLALNGKDYDGRLWRALNRFKYELAEAVVLPEEEALMRIVRFLEAMIRDEPKRPEAYMLLGAIYRAVPGWPVSIGDHERAMKLLNEGAKYAALNAEYLLELAGAYAAVGKKEEARKIYTRCIRKGTGPKDLEWEISVRMASGARPFGRSTSGGREDGLARKDECRTWWWLVA